MATQRKGETGEISSIFEGMPGFQRKFTEPGCYGRVCEMTPAKGDAYHGAQEARASPVEVFYGPEMCGLALSVRMFLEH